MLPRKIIIPIISIAILLVGIEVYVNYSIAELDCGLEKHETFKELPQDVKNQRCQEVFGLGYVFDRVKQSTEVIHTNSDGFRGYEITLEKPENTYRIFMVGGSTTYGDGIEDAGTMPFFLQKKFSSLDLGFDVQVINAGIPRAFSEGEVKLIKDRLLQYEPDLFVVYDGWNDSTNHVNGNTDENKWFDRWREICNLGKDQGFDVVVTIQPLAGTGSRIMTHQEYQGYIISGNEAKIEVYPLYLEKLHGLNDYCTKTADLTGMFDYVTEPIYYDNGHQGARGSQIIAENIFKLILPIMAPSYEATEDNIESTTTKPFYKTPYFISHISSVEHFISTTPEELDWIQSSFLYKNYSGQDLRNSILWDAENIRDYFSASNLSNANLSGVDLSGWDLRKTVLEGADLSYANLDGTELLNVNLNHAKLEGVSLANKDMRNSYLKHANLSGVDLSASNLTSSDLTRANLTNTTLDQTNLTNTILTNANLSGVDLSEAWLVSGVIKTIEYEDGTIGHLAKVLTDSNKFFSYEYIQRASFPGSDLTNANLSNSMLATIKFNNANAENADFSNSFLALTQFKNTNLKDANFQNSILQNTDFTNANLTGADFSGTVIHDNVIFDGAILDCINNPICNS